MDLSPYTALREYNNSFLVASLLTKKDQTSIDTKYQTPPDNLTDNLGMISALYIYTGTPPHGYGSQGPKVAETVKRAYDYNLKKSNKEIEINGYRIERLNWEESDGIFPFDETHGNFIPHDLKNMATKFLIKNVGAIDKCVENTIDKILNQNSDVLTKGRQTLDCFTGNSVTASVAYKRMYDFYVENLGIKITTCIEWIRCFFLCLQKNEIRTIKLRETKREKYVYNKKTKQREIKTTTVRQIVRHTIQGNEEVRKYMMNCARSFASYIKHKERSKKDRRAIASANMILRMFLYVIEDFHLQLGKFISGSTISIGGEEKKAKITNNLSEAMLTNHGNLYEIQGTEDATKWNECLSPATFGMMHKVFFDPEIRKQNNLEPVSDFGEIFRIIALSGHLIMSIKRIQMGLGPQAYNEIKYNRLNWKSTPINRFNTQTQGWLSFLRNKIDDENYLEASPGMLMGMLNAGSTTLGLLAGSYGLDPKNQCVITLRSSDDSTTIYCGSSVPYLLQTVETNRRALCAIGINLSLEKTFFYAKHYAEYTSWYQDHGFVSQFGVETSSLRPSGKNPPDDFYNVAKGTATGLSTLTFNHIGAEMRIKLGIDNVRKLWRITRNDTKREGISKNVLVLADGGNNLWNSTNCHLEEISMREKHITTDDDKKYLLRICNPKNPFCADPSEEVSYSVELGKLITTEVETPRTIFHYVKRSNRTVQNTVKKTMFDQEKLNSEASKIIKTIIPTTLVKYPNDSSRISHQLIAALSIYRSKLSLNPDQDAEFNNCISFLTNGKEDEEDIQEWEDEDL